VVTPDDGRGTEAARIELSALTEKLRLVAAERDRYAAALVHSEQELARAGLTVEREWFIAEIQRLNDELEDRERRLRFVQGSVTKRLLSALWALRRERGARRHPPDHE
jgi:hypothetical protein